MFDETKIIQRSVGTITPRFADCFPGARSDDVFHCIRKGFRCNDTVWESHMEKWVTTVVEKIRPQLASNGGPVIMLQIENEYAQDDDYLKWAVDMARNITTDVPWEICHDVPQCGQLNVEAGQDKVLCAINGFWMESGGGGGQPGPEYFDSLWESNPNQPGVWTEDQGWFDQWGVAQRIRWSNDQIYGIARFFAYGGSYHNFYMLTGKGDRTICFCVREFVRSFVRPHLSPFRFSFICRGCCCDRKHAARG